VIDFAWAGLAMHPMGWPTMAAKLRPGGIVLINTSVFEHAITYEGAVMSLAVTGMAAAAGMQQAGAMVALGAFAAATGIVKIETLHAIAEEVLPPYRRQFAAANRRALSIGYEAVAKLLCPACRDRSKRLERHAIARHAGDRHRSLQGLRAVHRCVSAEGIVDDDRQAQCAGVSLSRARAWLRRVSCVRLDLPGFRFPGLALCGPVATGTGEGNVSAELLEGSEAIARAMVSAGCKFFAGYPMTPFTEVLEGMAKLLPDAGAIA